MFGISGTELVAVIVLALILVGPERLPGYARRLAHVVRDLRRRWQDVRAQSGESGAAPRLPDDDAAALTPASGEPRLRARRARCRGRRARRAGR